MGVRHSCDNFFTLMRELTDSSNPDQERFARAVTHPYYAACQANSHTDGLNAMKDFKARKQQDAAQRVIDNVYVAVDDYSKPDSGTADPNPGPRGCATARSRLDGAARSLALLPAGKAAKYKAAVDFAETMFRTHCKRGG